jgi:hypothetical protein
MKIKQSANKHFEKDLPKAGGKTLTIVRSPTGVQAKSKRSLQGRLNPKLPINQLIVTYTPDVVTNVESSESEASGNESETSDVASVKDEAVQNRNHKEDSKHCAYSLTEHETAIGLPGRNVILSKTKNKQALYGKDQVDVVLFKSGKGDALLRGEKRRNWRSKKSCKLTIAQMVAAGLGLGQCKAFLKMSGINLKAIPEYCLLAADIVAHICDILKNECQMENVDVGSMSDYFHMRFADTRNRLNYIPEYVCVLIRIIY